MVDLDQNENLIVPFSKVPELRGWPTQTYGIPTDWERAMIVAAFRELDMCEPGLGETRCWTLAGQIVARLRRDHNDGDPIENG